MYCGKEPVTTHQEGYKAATALVFFVVIFFGCVYQATGKDISHAISSLLIFIAYIFFSNGYSIQKYQTALYVFVGLYFYTVLNSKLISQSAVVSIGMLASFLFFCTLNDLAQKKYCDNQYDVTNKKSKEGVDYLSLAKYALALILGLNAITLIVFYIVVPDRSTGLFKDFSQSAFSILLAFALLQPLIRNKAILLTPITLVFFLGFFTTFSRTATFLLGIYLIALFVIEHRNQSSRIFIKIFVLILLSYTLVKFYPLALDQTTVSRGLNDITTMNSRTFYWQAAWDAIQKSPVFGHGFHTFQFTGIKTLLPFRKITNIHNDYLQVWHDLGVIWLLFFISMVVIAMIKFSPLTFTLSPYPNIQLKQTSDKKIIAWTLLLCIVAYMSINFILLSTIFQVIFAIIIVELLRNEST